MRHTERHRATRIGWLRAAVLGANDGILSTGSIIVGVAAAAADRHQILLAGIAGLMAGAGAMAAGEYVSVSTQSDTQNADLAREREELETQDAAERAELAAIYESRGLQPALAREVADQLMAHDALGAHARDELGITEMQRAQPVQAALASAASFAMGGIAPVLVALLVPPPSVAITVSATSLLVLAVLGWLAAHAGGASPLVGAVRVMFWGALAMALTYGVGALFGTMV